VFLNSTPEKFKTELYFYGWACHPHQFFTNGAFFEKVHQTRGIENAGFVLV